MAKYILLGSAILATSSTALSIYLYWLHNDLSRKVQRTSRTGTLASELPRLAASYRSPQTVPAEVLDSGRFFYVHDRAWRVVPRTDVVAVPSEAVPSSPCPHETDETDISQDHPPLLTLYLRYTMGAFARYLPQAWLLRLVAPATTTFRPEYIGALNFERGDVVCGLYTVLLRTEDRVEFELTAPQPQPASSSSKTDGQAAPRPMQGRLIVGIVSDGDDDLVVYSETVMWKRVEDENRVTLPLERKVAKGLHELASWWLLDSGVRYLVGNVKGKGRKKTV